MENYQENWRRCLAMIREKLADKDDVYNTWFTPVTLYAYDPAQNVVTLAVPNEYIYKSMEHFFVRMIWWALSECFSKGVRLQYKLVRSEPTFADVAQYLQQHGYDSRRDPYHVRITDARKRLQDGLHYFLKGKERWLKGENGDGYDGVADWLTDNKGKGLLVIGAPGLGKSLICQEILPVILGNGGRPIVSVRAGELHDRVEELKKERILIIDDLGKEKRRYFGEIDNSFFELCSNAERTGQLLIIATSLSTTPLPANHPKAAIYPESILSRYGQDVISRLRAIVSVVELEGKDMRPDK